MTNEERDALAQQNHYVNQLVCGKQMWGPDYKLGILTDQGHKRIGTVRELYKLGWCEERFVVLDQTF